MLFKRVSQNQYMSEERYFEIAFRILELYKYSYTEKITQSGVKLGEINDDIEVNKIDQLIRNVRENDKQIFKTNLNRNIDYLKQKVYSLTNFQRFNLNVWINQTYDQIQDGTHTYEEIAYTIIHFISKFESYHGYWPIISHNKEYDTRVEVFKKYLIKAFAHEVEELKRKDTEKSTNERGKFERKFHILDEIFTEKYGISLRSNTLTPHPRPIFVPPVTHGVRMRHIRKPKLRFGQVMENLNTALDELEWHVHRGVCQNL